MAEPLVRWMVPAGYAGGSQHSDSAVAMYRAEDVEALIRNLEDEVREALTGLRGASGPTISEFVHRLAGAVRDVEEMLSMKEPR